MTDAAGRFPEDASLVGMLGARDEEALRIVREKYGRYAESIARRILPDPEDAAECVNDSIFAAWNSIPPQKPADLKTYLGRLCRNISLDRFRKLSAIKRGGSEVTLSYEEMAESMAAGAAAGSSRHPADIASGRLSDPAALYEERAAAEELSQIISRFLRTLPEPERNMFLRRYWYFDSVADIVRLTGFKESRVKMSLKRTRDRLARVLRGEGYTV